MSIGQWTMHRTLGLSDEEAVQMYVNMVKARNFDERSLLLQRSGKIAFHISGIGQEATQVGAAFALKPGTDLFFPYYRDYAFVLSVGMTLKELMLAAFAKAEDPSSGGRQMPGHFSCKRLGIATGSSPVATQIPQAAGVAYAAKLQRRNFVTYVTLGEGSTNQGDFHEGCNFAGVHKLPLIVLVENNQYAISVPVSKQLGGRVVDRAVGYGFAGVRVDGNDPLEVYRVVKEARERALSGEGPTLIEAMTYRLMPHSTSDDDLQYRAKEEVEAHWEQDGLVRYRNYLTECGLWSEAKEAELAEQVMREVNEATKYAEQAPYPAPEDALKHVYDEQGGLGVWQ